MGARHVTDVAIHMKYGSGSSSHAPTRMLHLSSGAMQRVPDVKEFAVAQENVLKIGVVMEPKPLLFPTTKLAKV